jgi:hypothetical protein
MDSASQSNVRVASEPSAVAGGNNTFCDGRTFNTAEQSATAGDGEPRRRAPVYRAHHPMATGEGRSH